MRNFNHVILPRLPTSEIILLIFRRDIIIVHYRPRYAVKRDLSGVRGHRQDKHVSECLKIRRARARSGKIIRRNVVRSRDRAPLRGCP